MSVIRVYLGNFQGNFFFRASRQGIDCLTLEDGEDATLHEDQTPVAALYSGVWESGGSDSTTISLPGVGNVLPFNVLMNADDGSVMLDCTYYAEWLSSSKQLRLTNRLSARTIKWAVLVDL